MISKGSFSSVRLTQYSQEPRITNNLPGMAHHAERGGLTGLLRTSSGSPPDRPFLLCDPPLSEWDRRNAWGGTAAKRSGAAEKDNVLERERLTIRKQGAEQAPLILPLVESIPFRDVCKKVCDTNTVSSSVPSHQMAQSTQCEVKPCISCALKGLPSTLFWNKEIPKKWFWRRR